jgi:hypothetical protein
MDYSDMDNDPASPEQNWDIDRDEEEVDEEFEQEVQYFIDDGFPRDIAIEFANQTLGRD